VVSVVNLRFESQNLMKRKSQEDEVCTGNTAMCSRVTCRCRFRSSSANVSIF
jgi:hypothetical protein